jgi:hypothetical protein
MIAIEITNGDDMKPAGRSRTEIVCKRRCLIGDLYGDALLCFEGFCESKA